MWRKQALLWMLVVGLAGCRLPGDGPVSQSLLTSRHLSQQGVAAMEQANWEQAETILAKAVRACPADAEARRHHGEALWQRGDRQQAMAELEQAARLTPEDAAIHARLAEMRLAMGHIVAARQAVEQALDLDPKLASAWAVRARVMRAGGDAHQALADFHRALGYAPDDRQVLMETAEIYRELGQPQRALSTLQKLGDTFPPGEETPQVLFLLGQAYAATGRNDDAVETYATALARDPANAELLAKMAEAQLARGRPNEAGAAAREALGINPDHEASRRLLERIETARQELPGVMR